MPFVLPTFNVPVNVWTKGAYPPSVPRLTGLLANVSLGKRVLLGADSSAPVNVLFGTGIDVILRIMMVPAGTDLRGAYSVHSIDLVEMPAASGAFYLCIDVADMAKGFANEHRVAWLVPSADFPLPEPLP